jgi:SAM-dependent methyltransferase
VAKIDLSFGREAFGGDPAGYDASRPDYPDWVYETLAERCALAPGCAAFEVGSGTGIATRRLLAQGAHPLVAVEPDPRLAGYLRASTPSTALHVLVSPFEEALLDDAAFDLGFSATAFHWLDENKALARVARALKPGGWWAMVWNIFGDPAREDRFHEATLGTLGRMQRSPSSPARGKPFGVDVEARKAAIARTTAFKAVTHRIESWTLVLDPDQVVALYSTYSDMNIRPPDERAQVLSELHRIATDEFAGRVTRNMQTVLYTAQRR